MTNFDIIFQDIIITEQKFSTYGEFKLERDPEDISEASENLVARLNEQIRELASHISHTHQKNNCIPNTLKLKEDNQNTITRLITAECYFYTQRPLSIHEFEALMQEIANFASEGPENLHLILGSFAVIHDNKVMNVVPIVECGPKPKMDLIVKNNFSERDPVYKRYENEVLTVLSHLDKTNALPPPIFIEDIGECAFTFNPVSKKETAGHVPFYFCLDICLDHYYGVAKRAFISQLVEDLQNDIDLIPQFYSHIVVAHSIPLIEHRCLGTATRADPDIFRLNSRCKANVKQQNHVFENSSFGSPSRMVITDPSACDKLPSNLNFLFIRDLGNYIKLRDDECKGIDPKLHSKFRLFKHPFGATAAHKINAAIHAIDLLIDNNQAEKFFRPKEELYLKKGRLGKITEQYTEDFERLRQLDPFFYNRYLFV